MKSIEMLLQNQIASEKPTETTTIDSQFAKISAKKTMKVLVVNAYIRDNAGDAALLSVLLDQIKKAFPDSEIWVAGMESPQRFVDFEGIANLGSIRRWLSDEDISRPDRITRKLIAGLIGIFWFRSPKKLWHLIERCLPSEPRNELRAIRTADLVVGLGGGYLKGDKSLGGELHVFYVLLPLALTKRLKKPVVLAPQSYGPFSSKRQKKAVESVLSETDAIFVREDTSMTQLTSLGVKPQRLERAIDSGFAFQSDLKRDWRDELSVNSSTSLVGITARQWLGPKAQAQYEEALSLTADYIQTNHTSRVVLIPQVTVNYQQDDDRIVQHHIAARCISEPKPINLTNLSGHHELRSLYENLDYLIGTRFHSVIFALSSFVPCIAIEYEHKTGGIMRELGLERWVIPIEDVTNERLQSLFDELIHDANAYREYLRKIIPPYVSQAQTFVTTLKQTMSQVSN